MPIFEFIHNNYNFSERERIKPMLLPICLGDNNIAFKYRIVDKQTLGPHSSVYKMKIQAIFKRAIGVKSY